MKFRVRSWVFAVQLSNGKVTGLMTDASSLSEATANIWAKSGQLEWPMDGAAIRHILSPTIESYTKHLADELLIP